MKKIKYYRNIIKRKQVYHRYCYDCKIEEKERERTEI